MTRSAVYALVLDGVAISRHEDEFAAKARAFKRKGQPGLHDAYRAAEKALRELKKTVDSHIQKHEHVL